VKLIVVQHVLVNDLVSLILVISVLDGDMTVQTIETSAKNGDAIGRLSILEHT